MTTESMYRILIIEDDLHLLNMYARALQTEGYTVRVASNVEEARLMIEYWQFDLILTDVQLGGYVATTLLERYFERLKRKHTRVVVMSAAEENRQLVNQFDIETFLLKPITPRTLQTLVASLVEASGAVL
ncbi:MAG: response regulator [Phototrophicaceae bacterium]